MADGGNIWANRDEALRDADLIDFDVQTSDGPAGTVSSVTYDQQAAYLVIRPLDPRDPDHVVAVPTSRIADIDQDGELVRLDITSDELRRAPAHHEPTGADPAVWNEIGAYWGDPQPADTSGPRDIP